MATRAWGGLGDAAVHSVESESEQELISATTLTARLARQAC